MKKYHKIESIFLRDPANQMKTFLMGRYSRPEFGWLEMNNWEATEKVDGTNIRVHWDGETITYGGRTEDSQIPATLYDAFRNLFREKLMENAFESSPSYDGAKKGTADVTLYGEGYGPKIQKGGGKYRQDQSFVLFDVRIGGIWLERKDVEDIAKKLRIDAVPVLGVAPLMVHLDMCKEGFMSRWGDFEAEGVVLRPSVGLLCRDGRRIITKIKCKDFPK